MGVYMTEDDFAAIMLSPPNPMREIVLRDASARFKLPKYDNTSAGDFKKEMLTECSHYFQAPVADTVEHAAFYSLSAQGAYVREHGEAATRELLKTEGLKLGQVKPAPKAEVTGSNNPYSPEFKGTEAQREARIQSLIKSSATLATQLAKAAGKTLTNQPLQKVGQHR